MPRNKQAKSPKKVVLRTRQSPRKRELATCESDIRTKKPTMDREASPVKDREPSPAREPTPPKDRPGHKQVDCEFNRCSYTITISHL